MENGKLKMDNEVSGDMKFRYRTDDEMKDSGVEWIGKIPKEWILSKLKYNLSKIGSGKTPKGGAEIYVDKGVVFIRSQNVCNDGLRLQDTVYISDEINNEMKNTTVNYNDILLNITGGSIGRSCIVDISEISANVNQHVCILRPILQKINPIYLHATIQSNIIQTQIQAFQNSSNREGLNFEQIGNMQFTICKNNHELKKIATFIDEKTSEFDSIISKKEALIQKLEEAKKSLISEVVTGKVKVVKTSDGYELVERKKEEMKDSGVEWLGDIPREWDVTKLKFIGEAITGLTYSPNDIVDENNGTLVLRSSNVKNGRIILEDNVFVSMDIPNKLYTKEGDILICSRNGSRALIGKNACIDKGNEGKSFGAFMTVFRSKYYEFLNFVFNSEIFKAQAGSFLTSTINQLTIGNLNSFVIPFPTADEQKEITTFMEVEVNKFNKINTIINEQISKLKEAKQSLITEAVTGKIKIL